MIVKIDLSQIYDMNSKLILGNKYKRVEGKLYETGYSPVTIATGSMGNEVFSSGSKDSPDGRIFSYMRPSIGGGYDFASYGLRIRYEVIRCEVYHSTSDPVMETKTSDFFTDLSYSGTKKRLTHSISPIPDMFWLKPELIIGTGSASNYASAAKSLLGNGAMTVVSADYYSAVIDVGVITSVEVWSNSKWSLDPYLESLNPFSGSKEATYSLSNYTFNVLNNTFYKDSNPYTYGDTDKKYTYKYYDNILITENSKVTNNDSEISLIEYLYNKITVNYKNGKQVVNLSISEGNYKLDDDSISYNHLFELGQYIQLYDGLTPLIYYKLTNIVKTFEIIECEYRDESWNLIVKEVSKVESN